MRAIILLYIVSAAAVLTMFLRLKGEDQQHDRTAEDAMWARSLDEWKRRARLNAALNRPDPAACCGRARKPIPRTNTTYGTMAGSAGNPGLPGVTAANAAGFGGTPTVPTPRRTPSSTPRSTKRRQADT